MQINPSATTSQTISYAESNWLYALAAAPEWRALYFVEADYAALPSELGSFDVLWFSNSIGRSARAIATLRDLVATRLSADGMVLIRGWGMLTSSITSIFLLLLHQIRI